MENSGHFERSPLLMGDSDTSLLVVDMQPRLLKAMPQATTIVWNASRLLRAADTLGLPAVATEQVPDKLGATVDDLAALIGQTASKDCFSAYACETLFSELRAEARHRVLVVGIEAHVCVQQTTLDLHAAGFDVYVAIDAIDSRFTVDKETAIRRMESSGITITTTEAAIMEWTTSATHASFREISALLKESRPTE